jgi:hypothetical protein
MPRGVPASSWLTILLQRITTQLVLEAVTECNGNRSDAARVLGVDKSFVSREVRKENKRLFEAQRHLHCD